MREIRYPTKQLRMGDEYLLRFDGGEETVAKLVPSVGTGIAYLSTSMELEGVRFTFSDGATKYKILYDEGRHAFRDLASGQGVRVYEGQATDLMGGRRRRRTRRRKRNPKRRFSRRR